MKNWMVYWALQTLNLDHFQDPKLPRFSAPEPCCSASCGSASRSSARAQRVRIGPAPATSEDGPQVGGEAESNGFRN